MDLGNLFQNKLFLQYLSQAGQGMASGEGVAPGLNQVTQQNIQAQNFMQLLREFLGPSGSKMTADSKGMRIDLPADQAQGFFQADPNLTSQIRTESQPAQQAGGTQPMANPFGQASSEGFGGIGNIDPSMLAGLTPEHLTSIMGLKMKQEEFGRQSVKDAQDALYKEALMNEAIARTEKLGRPETLDQPYPIKGPGGREITLREWNALPSSDREYLTYVDGARRLDDGDILSKRDWEALKPTDKEKYLRAVGSDPELFRLHKELTPASESGRPTWNAAFNKLQEIYGKMDPTGQFVITEGNQGRYLVAMQKFSELSTGNDLNPIEAVNVSHRYVKALENNYSKALREAKTPAEKASVKNAFYSRYGYIPGGGK